MHLGCLGCSIPLLAALAAAAGLVLAVLASGVVGLIADSVLFLWLAFGSLDFLAGQIVGKLWMVVLSLPFIHWIRKREIARQFAVS